MAASESTRARGHALEALAAAHLTGRGLRLVEANAQFRVGELDLVMDDGGTLVFVEVRYRARSDYGDGADSVDWRKMRKLARAAQAWLLHHPEHAQRPCRFDVVSLDGCEQAPGVDWIRDAFRLDDLR
ncbi:MAG: YraN family protein [Lysobacteraceae bacterium]